MAEICGIVSNEKITAGHEVYAMVLSAPGIAKEAKPGQFLHIKCAGLTLRRPISIASAKNGELTLCYEVRGEGTAWMAGLKSGGEIDVIGPLGNGFGALDSSKKALLVGGGVGIFPLYAPAEIFGGNAISVLGFRTGGLVVYEREFAGCGGEVHIATDDGSYGKKGFATDVAKEILDNCEIELILCCGPKMMMKAVALEAAKRGIKCLVSFEERMACGVGACLACVCRANGKNKRVCTDGPVFEAGEIDWDW